MLDLNFIIPEIFLTLSILIFVIIGVFIKNSFEIIYKLSLFLIFLLIVIIYSNSNEYSKIFNESISIDMFSIYSKNSCAWAPSRTIITCFWARVLNFSPENVSPHR